MNEDIKIDVYQNLISGKDDFEKEAVKKTACILFADIIDNGTKEIYFYSSDFMNDGIDMFQFEYNVNYDSGEFREGNGFVDTQEILDAFGFTNYDELKAYVANKYNDDEDAWQKIVEELEAKGLNPNVEESEGDSNFMMNF